MRGPYPKNEVLLFWMGLSQVVLVDTLRQHRRPHTHTTRGGRPLCNASASCCHNRIQPQTSRSVEGCYLAGVGLST